MKIKSILFTSVIIIVLSSTALARAGENATEKYSWYFTYEAIKKGYTVSTPDEMFNIGVLPDVLKGNTEVTIKVFDHKEYEERKIYQVNGMDSGESSPEKENLEQPRLIMDWPVPEGKKIISPIYEFAIVGGNDLYNPEKPLWLRMHYQASTNDNKSVYFWDKGGQQWIEIPTWIDEHTKSLKTAIHLIYAPMAIFADEISTTGEASWYKYQNCNCAASRDYPAWTLLKVTDVSSGKSVIVEVNDYGPEIETGRIIDLDLFAFEQLTEKWRGVVQVKVEPYIIDEQSFQESLPDSYNLQEEL